MYSHRHRSRKWSDQCHTVGIQKATPHVTDTPLTVGAMSRVRMFSALISWFPWQHVWFFMCLCGVSVRQRPLKWPYQDTFLDRSLLCLFAWTLICLPALTSLLNKPVQTRLHLNSTFPPTDFLQWFLKVPRKAGFRPAKPLNLVQCSSISLLFRPTTVLLSHSWRALHHTHPLPSPLPLALCNFGEWVRSPVRRTDWESQLKAEL